MWFSGLDFINNFKQEGNMRLITRKFFETSSIEKNEDSIAVMDFLSRPEIVQKMISASEAHCPALSAIVAELEERFANSNGFPLHHDAPDKNAKNRRNVGWMVRFIMREFGYSPVKNSDKTRIGNKSGAKYFVNASLYEKTDDYPDCIMFSSTVLFSRLWKKSDMKLDRYNPDYEKYKEKIMIINEKMKNIGVSREYLLEYLHRVGFKNLISFHDLELFLSGENIPCIELYESINSFINILDFFDEIIAKKLF